MAHSKALPRDTDSAREDGEAFGLASGRRAAAAMTRPGLSHAEVTAIGSEAAGAVLAKANSLADAGLARELVEAWTEAAAEAFNLELGRAASLLAASGTRH